MTSDAGRDPSAPIVVERRTRETAVRVQVAEGTLLADARAVIRTGEAFLDHMLVTLARYAAVDLRIEASGDLRHHLVEDVAIAVGTAIARHQPANSARYGHWTIPMDDALVEVALDLGGRPYYRGPLPSRLYDHWMRSFSDHARATLHVRVVRGRDRHHVIEAAFKGLGVALRQALCATPTTMSTKGPVTW
jgi:imidazoleglycerol-phosphate dehydratase